MMERIIYPLAAIFWLLTGSKNLQVDTYELKYKPDFFDDQYIGCSHSVAIHKMPEILHREMSNQQFNEAWKNATIEWKRIVSNFELPEEFEDEHGIALLVFTNKYPEGNPIYRQFNGNLTIAGASRKDYMDKFHFKALHFYLTRALQILKPDCSSNYTTFRGSHDAYKLSPGFKFGRFTSSSLNPMEAVTFGIGSLFCITTCFGAKIGNFSFFPEENEILIPPTEKFTYVTKLNSVYLVESTGEMCSYFNCAIMGAEKQSDAVCISGAAASVDDRKNKKSQAQMSPAEQEERIGTLEYLITQNHEKWDIAQKVTEQSLNNSQDLILIVSNVTALYKQIEELSTRSQRTLQQSIESTSELVEKGVSGVYTKLGTLLKSLNQVVDKQTTLSESISEVEDDLQSVKDVMETDRTKVADVRNTVKGLQERMQSLEALSESVSEAKEDLQRVKDVMETDKITVTDVHNTVQKLLERIQSLEVSREELLAANQNMKIALVLLVSFGICTFIHRFFM
ncbi:polyamine-modulated factor 1-binding protein 1-like [Hyperolius riggenbachi]|uniref:polyamine-modulated factor 1-binding protein 1-like n=1 Tax=Hyperolius riggenbachi TaxID=752182 RepID=UPI0035A38F06